MSSFTEEQLHDLLGRDGPPSIRELALQSMTTRNDALKDNHRDRKHQHPTVLNQTRELMQQQIKGEMRTRDLTEKQLQTTAEIRMKRRGLTEKQQSTEDKKEKRVHFAEEEKPGSKTINLHQKQFPTTTRNNNFLLILLVILALSSLAYLYWPRKGSSGGSSAQ